MVAADGILDMGKRMPCSQIEKGGQQNAQQMTQAVSKGLWREITATVTGSAVACAGCLQILQAAISLSSERKIVWLVDSGLANGHNGSKRIDDGVRRRSVTL